MSKRDPQALHRQLHKLDFSLFGGDFLRTWDHKPDELKAVLLTAELLRALYRGGNSTRLFESGLAVGIFRDKSTRTRFSFASAADLLGLAFQELEEIKTQIAHGETVRETSNMVSFLTQVIGIRDDQFLGAGHQYMIEVAEAVDNGFEEGVLMQRPAVINLQSDQDHPTQALADLMHLVSTFGSLEALAGKKIAVTWAYSPSYGKPLSVPQGSIALFTRLGMDVVLAHPEGYDLMPEVLSVAADNAGQSGGTFQHLHSMEDAFEAADVVYPKSWAPLQICAQRTELLRTGNEAELDELEKQCLIQNAEFQNWECNEDMMARTREGKALYMHCLPADITSVNCAGGEVAAAVFDRYRIHTYEQASYKPFVIAAMILLTRFEEPVARVEQLLTVSP